MTATKRQDPTEAEPLEQQIERLAAFIMDEVPGEPSESEGAVDCAIRLLRAAYVAGGSGVTAVLVEQGELERIRVLVDKTREHITAGHMLAAAEYVNEAITYLDAVQARMDAGGEARFGDISDRGPAVRPS